MRLRKSGFTYSTCQLIAKIKGRRQKFKERENVIFFKQFLSVLYSDISIFENYTLLWFENTN